MLSETSVILRLNDDGSTPSDNPLNANAGCGARLRLRNPQLVRHGLRRTDWHALGH